MDREGSSPSVRTFLRAISSVEERVAYIDEVAGSSPALPTFEKKSISRLPPHFARRLICIGFSAQKRICDFERKKEKILIIIIMKKVTFSSYNM